MSKNDKLSMLFDILNIRGLTREEARELKKLTGLNYSAKVDY